MQATSSDPSSSCFLDFCLEPTTCLPQDIRPCFLFPSATNGVEISAHNVRTAEVASRIEHWGENKEVHFREFESGAGESSPG